MAPSLSACATASLAISAADFPATATAFAKAPCGVRTSVLSWRHSSHNTCNFSKSGKTIVFGPFYSRRSCLQPVCTNTGSVLPTTNRHNNDGMNAGTDGDRLSMIAEYNNRRDGKVEIQATTGQERPSPGAARPTHVTVGQDIDPKPYFRNDSEEVRVQLPSQASFLDELLQWCAEATKPGAAMESVHTGSSEWAGFQTTKSLLEVSSLDYFSFQTNLTVAGLHIGN